MSERNKVVLDLFEKEAFVESMLSCENDEQLIELLKEYDVELDKIDISQLKDELKKMLFSEGELTEDSLESISGGVVRMPNPVLTGKALDKMLRWLKRCF